MIHSLISRKSVFIVTIYLKYILQLVFLDVYVSMTFSNYFMYIDISKKLDDKALENHIDGCLQTN